MTVPNRHVRRLTHARGANFSLGFRLLPAAKRRAVYAAYAACRIPDDIVDEPGDGAGQDTVRRRLDAWETEVRAAYRGEPSHPATVALAQVLGEFAIPQDALLSLVEGCRMDMERTRYASFEELEAYCELVAVTISRISLAIFGALDEDAHELGRNLAMALQLTNISRDVGEDLQRDRIYLPEDEMTRFGVSPAALRAGEVETPEYRELMAFQCRRALGYFCRARELPSALERDSRAAVRVMAGVYRRVLGRVAADPVLAFTVRAELPAWERWWTIAAGLAGLPFAPRCHAD